MLKISLFLRNFQTSWANKSRILSIKNAKFSWYCFYMNRNIQGDFQICISAPLTLRVCTAFKIFEKTQAILLYWFAAQQQTSTTRRQKFLPKI